MEMHRNVLGKSVTQTLVFNVHPLIVWRFEEQAEEMSGKRLQRCLILPHLRWKQYLNFIYLFCSMFVKYIFGYVQENGTSFLDKLWHRCHFETLSKTCLGFKKKRCVKGMKCWLQSTNKHCTGKKKKPGTPWTSQRCKWCTLKPSGVRFDRK